MPSLGRQPAPPATRLLAAIMSPPLSLTSPCNPCVVPLSWQSLPYLHSSSASRGTITTTAVLSHLLARSARNLPPRFIMPPSPSLPSSSASVLPASPEKKNTSATTVTFSLSNPQLRTLVEVWYSVTFVHLIFRFETPSPLALLAVTAAFYVRLVFFTRAMLSTEPAEDIDQHVFIRRFMRGVASTGKWWQSPQPLPHVPAAAAAAAGSTTPSLPPRPVAVCSSSSYPPQPSSPEEDPQDVPQLPPSQTHSLSRRVDSTMQHTHHSIACMWSSGYASPPEEGLREVREVRGEWAETRVRRVRCTAECGCGLEERPTYCVEDECWAAALRESDQRPV